MIRALLICSDVDGCVAAAAATHPFPLEIRAPHQVDAALWCAAPVVLVSGCCLDQVPTHSPRPDVYLLATTPDQATTTAARRLAWTGVFTVPADSTRLRATLREVLTVPRRMIGVIAGTGGAGASTLATAIAVRALRQRRSALLVDTDPLGGGLGHLVGDLHTMPVDDLVGRITLLDWDIPTLELDPQAALRVVTTVVPQYPVTVVDLPRRLDAAARVFAHACQRLIMIVPGGDDHTISATRQVLTSLEDVTDRRRVWVATRTLPGCYPPIEVAAALGLPLATDIGPLADAAAAIFADLGN